MIIIIIVLVKVVVVYENQKSKLAQIVFYKNNNFLPILKHVILCRFVLYGLTDYFLVNP